MFISHSLQKMYNWETFVLDNGAQCGWLIKVKLREKSQLDRIFSSQEMFK